MLKKNYIIVIAFTFVVSLALMGGIGLGAPGPFSPTVTLWPEPTFPAPTIDPAATLTGADSTVNITDSNLKAALKAACGLAASATIKRSDLAKLSGGLDLSSKSIVKLEGIQYCENITALKLTDNKITEIPSSFSKLVKLQTLILDSNKLTKQADALFSLTALTTLSMANNDITKIADKINLLAQLTTLDMSGNELTTVPTNIGKLSKLQNLNLSENNFKTVPREIFLLGALTNLDLSGNTLKALPNEAAAMPSLAALNVENNILDTLPAGLGNAPKLIKVYASINRLTVIEPSLLNGKVSTLMLDVNRLTELPQVLSGKTFDAFNVEWNFIDMSEGSAARTIADSVNAPTGKFYLRQLKILPEPQKRETTTTVMLQWDLMADGEDGDSSWKVNKYQIYIDNNGSWGSPIAVVDRLANIYVATDLKSDKSYKFQVGVEYALTLNGQRVTHRYFTPVEAKTLSASATVAPTVEPTPTPTEAVAATVAPTASEPAATEPPAPAPKRNTTLLIILIVAGAVVAIALVWVVVMSMTRRNQRPY